MNILFQTRTAFSGLGCCELVVRLGGCWLPTVFAFGLELLFTAAYRKSWNGWGMKKSLVSIAIAGLAFSATGQGSLNFGNSFFDFRAPIYGEVPGNPIVSLVGQSAIGIPSGAVSYGGASLLSGTGYTLALFAGPSSISDPSLLTFVASTAFRTGSAAGLVSVQTVAIPGVLPGQTAKFQIRAWDNLGGTVTNWTQVRDENPAFVQNGYSFMVTSGPLGGMDSGGNLFTTPDLKGWTSFNIWGTPLTPEPSTYAVAGLAAVMIYAFRHRK